MGGRLNFDGSSRVRLLTLPDFELRKEERNFFRLAVKQAGTRFE